MIVCANTDQLNPLCTLIMHCLQTWPIQAGCWPCHLQFVYLSQIHTRMAGYEPLSDYREMSTYNRFVATCTMFNVTKKGNQLNKMGESYQDVIPILSVTKMSIEVKNGTCILLCYLNRFSPPNKNATDVEAVQPPNEQRSMINACLCKCRSITLHSAC